MRSTKIKNALLEIKLCRLRGKRNRRFESDLKSFPVPPTGFTILEIMVALVIMGISLGIFFSLIGNSSRLRGKIDDHTRALLLARTKIEEAFLGILGKKHIRVNERKTFEGVTKDGIPWKVLEVNKYKEAMKRIDMNTSDTWENSMAEVPPKGTTLLSSVVGGISIETIFFTEEPEGRLDAEDSEEQETGSDED
ncbi:MAG: type II secretion system protein [Candidatus Brocadia sp.]|jgi:prepilin-type N-terminal cleavage/methylation domain-containing protein